MNILKAINNLLFPPRCIFCDGILDFRTTINVCDKCKNTVPAPKGLRCTYCFRKTRGYFGTDLCHHCRSKRPYFDRVVSVFEYDGLVRDCVIRLKFHKRTDHASAMGHYMALKAEDFGNADILIPVPISKERMYERGYNQSELFTKTMSKRLNIPMITNALYKIKDTPPQSTLKFERRAENVKGAYKVYKPELIKGKNILLTDDVTTTRSSLNECARMLKKAGAKSVVCVTFAVAEKD